MLVKEVIQRVQSLYSKGVQSDDSRLTPRHIYSKLIAVRNKLVTEKLNKKQKISRWNYQVLQCIKLIKIPTYDCPCVPPVGCSVWRTVSKIPKPLTNLNKDMIQSVTSIDGAVQFSETSWEAQKYKLGNRYTAYKPDYYIHDGYMFFVGKHIPKMVTITGLFEDPMEIVFVSYCDEETITDCTSPLDQDFPIDAEDVEPMIQIAIQELVGVFGQRQQDLYNNTLDDILPQQIRREKNNE